MDTHFVTIQIVNQYSTGTSKSLIKLGMKKLPFDINLLLKFSCTANRSKKLKHDV